MIRDTACRNAMLGAAGTTGWTTMTAQEALAPIQCEISRRPIPLAIQNHETAALIARYAGQVYHNVCELRCTLPVSRFQMFGIRPRMYITATNSRRI
ncbi:MAG: hypothetical protein M1415_09030 [Firmicutes bacterium]|nr:hypothetical protein [Bacillota bacterium]